MKTFDFLVDSVADDGLVLGRNGYVDIPAGTVFTSITKSRVDKVATDLVDVELGELAKIELILLEVHWYHKVIDTIPSGHSAGLVLRGQGVAALRQALGECREHEYIHLRATSEA